MLYDISGDLIIINFLRKKYFLKYYHFYFLEFLVKVIVRNDHLLIVKEERMMINSEIENLIVKALFKEITDDEQRQLDEWLNVSESNRIFFERLHSEGYLKGAIGDRNRELREESWKRLERRTVGEKGRKIRLFVLRVAAMLALPLLVGGIMWYMSEHGMADLPLANQEIKVGGSKAVVTLSTGEQLSLFGDTTVCVNDGLATLVNTKDTLNFMKGDHPVVVDNSYNVIQIPRGGEYIVRLEDGTTVYLNSESELRIPVHFGKDERLVWLTGEAYFSVKHEKDRKFVVRTNKADIAVLGTEFGVRVYSGEDELLTTLVKGSVEVKSDHDIHRIVPGEQATVDNMGKIEVREVNVDEFVAWKSGRVVFVNARLEDIMDELQRWYDFNVFYSSPELKELRFTMDIMKYKEVSEIFELMEKIKKVSFSVNGNNVILK